MGMNCLIGEGLIEGTRSRGIPRAKYISQIIKMQELLLMGGSKIWQVIGKNEEGIFCCE